MLQYGDYQLIKEFVEKNPDFKDILNKIMNHQKVAISTITHEVRNSLTLIDSSVQLIQKMHPEVTSFNYWNETLAEISYLERLTKSFSDERFGDFIALKPLQIDTVITSVKMAIKNLDEATNFTCIFTTADNLPSIMGDELKLRQTLINIIRNACHAMGRSGCIYMTTTQADNMIRIDIRDTGGGLPPGVEDTLFEPFVTTKPDGSGLGLAVAKSIIEAHGGQLSVDSRPGDGCTFTILLPIASQ